MALNTVDFLGLPLSPNATIENLCALLEPNKGPHFISFINPAAWALARRNPVWLDWLRGMDYVLADGVGTAASFRLLKGYPCPRISFDMSSLADPFFTTMIQQGKNLALLGSAPGVAEAMKTKLGAHYQGLTVLSAEHGYGDLTAMVVHIMELHPDVVLIGMGAPRQEECLIKLKEAGFQGLGISCGGFFDQYVAATHYYPYWIDKLNLRFAYRLWKEPRRLWRRYLIDYQVFIFRFVCSMLWPFSRP